MSSGGSKELEAGAEPSTETHMCEPPVRASLGLGGLGHAPL